MPRGTRERQTYAAWQDIKRRCFNPRTPNFKDYGGRGITMHAPWRQSFAQFLADVGCCPAADLSVGRIHNDGNYEPGNVRWETEAQQHSNMRSNRWLTNAGRTLTLTQWADELGVKPALLTGRLRRGWSVERALTTPLPSASGHHPRRVASGASHPSARF